MTLRVWIDFRSCDTSFTCVSHVRIRFHLLRPKVTGESKKAGRRFSRVGNARWTGSSGLSVQMKPTGPKPTNHIDCYAFDGVNGEPKLVILSLRSHFI